MIMMIVDSDQNDSRSKKKLSLPGEVLGLPGDPKKTSRARSHIFP